MATLIKIYDDYMIGEINACSAIAKLAALIEATNYPRPETPELFIAQAMLVRFASML